MECKCFYYFSDRENFEGPEKVEALQEKYNKILLVLLQKRYGSKKHLKYASMISGMQLLRSVSYGADQEFKKPDVALMRTIVSTPLVEELLVERGIPPNPLPPTPPM